MAGLSSLISLLRVPLMTTRPTAFSPLSEHLILPSCSLILPLMTTHPTAFSLLSEQQPAENRPTSIEVAWPVTAGLGVRVLTSYFQATRSLLSN
ncbi:hypothetical protein AVEN_260802-1 [Araneus ventricosus]|uniref:Uncharacterized protein n=1 Tax=Araneus ventricosus TaxID=182803 RepID=A0A4Y2FFY2_ARAVE|nr:hypothetical protein AVEN_260802-1 [Araneus ventricosus]